MKKIAITIAIVLVSITSFAQKEGVILEKYGKVYASEKPSLNFENDKEYKVIFDIYKNFSKEDEVNPQLNTIIAYLETSTKQGVVKENMKVAVIFHGTATKNVLTNTAYRKLFDIDNPNIELIEKLKDADVELYVDRKSYFGNVYELKDKSPAIKMSYSALVTLTEYKNEGYQIINSF